MILSNPRFFYSFILILSHSFDFEIITIGQEQRRRCHARRKAWQRLNKYSSGCHFIAFKAICQDSASGLWALLLSIDRYTAQLYKMLRIQWQCLCIIYWLNEQLSYDISVGLLFVTNRSMKIWKLKTAGPWTWREREGGDCDERA